MAREDVRRGIIDNKNRRESRARLRFDRTDDSRSHLAQQITNKTAAIESHGGKKITGGTALVDRIPLDANGRKHNGIFRASRRDL